MDQQPLCRPSAERIERANVPAFARQIAEEHGSEELRDFPRLRAWSAANPRAFWPAVWEFCGVRASRGWDEVLVDEYLMPGARWFTGARLNFAENLLHFRDDDRPETPFVPPAPAASLPATSLSARVAARGPRTNAGATRGDNR